MATTTTYSPRLQKKYREEAVPALMKKFGYKTVMQCPRLVKICLNQGVKGSTSDKKMIDDAVNEMTLVTGQKAIPTMSKKDISNFKLRKNMPIGCRVSSETRWSVPASIPQQAHLGCDRLPFSDPSITGWICR